MLPPYGPTRRKKVSTGKARKLSHNGAAVKTKTKAKAKADVTGTGDGPVRPAMRVLGREVPPSPIVAARKRRIGC
jgi:hypothetical protein